MLPRRTLLTGGLVVGASAVVGNRTLIAKQKHRRRRWKQQRAVVEHVIDVSGQEIDVTTDIYVVASGHKDAFKHLERSRRPIEIAISATLGPFHPVYTYTPYRQRFNHRGYRYIVRRRYGVKVPITGKPKHHITITAHVYEGGLLPTQTFRGKGRPGRWIWLRPLGTGATP